MEENDTDLELEQSDAIDEIEVDEISNNKSLPVKKENRPYGKRNPNALVEERCRRLYTRQLDGLPVRHLVYAHASKESISLSTAWRDWEVVREQNTKDWNIDRESILSRIQAMRLRVVHAAIKKGQLQTAAQILKDIGAVVGEVAPENAAMLAPILNIMVEESRPKNLSSGSEPVNITPALESVPENLSLDAE
jgi:hypothetical protein